MSRKVLYALFFIGIGLICLGILLCAIGLNKIGVPWHAIRGILNVAAGIFLIWWGVNVLNREH